ncbi:MAG: glycine cleavage system protein GcvH [Chitinophagaceae bacterium]
MQFPEELRYSKDHIWVKTENDLATLGITFFAQLELGEVAFVQIKSPKKHFQQGKVFGTIEALKTVTDIFMPVAACIVEINQFLVNDPGLVNKDPYKNGWLIKIKPDNINDLSHLMNSIDYDKFVNG